MMRNYKKQNRNVKKCKNGAWHVITHTECFCHVNVFFTFFLLSSSFIACFGLLTGYFCCCCWHWWCYNIYYVVRKLFCIWLKCFFCLPLFQVLFAFLDKKYTQTIRALCNPYKELFPSSSRVAFAIFASEKWEMSRDIFTMYGNDSRAIWWTEHSTLVVFDCKNWAVYSYIKKWVSFEMSCTAEWPNKSTDSWWVEHKWLFFCSCFPFLQRAHVLFVFLCVN